MDDLRYPVGRYERPESSTPEQRAAWIRTVAELPARIRAAVTGLDDARLDTPYREGGWTVRQVVHHVPDSHMNAYVRFKLALTEDSPVIRPYQEGDWARLPDSIDTPPEVSLTLLDALHDRWVRLMRALTDEQWARTYRHPEMGAMRLDQVLALYAWHSLHHVAHITNLRRREGW